MAEILSLCRYPQKKTRIMQQINLSWTTAQQYLDAFVARDLLQVHHSEVRYETTQKGIVLLERLGRCTELLTVKDPREIEIETPARLHAPLG